MDLSLPGYEDRCVFVCICVCSCVSLWQSLCPGYLIFFVRRRCWLFIYFGSMCILIFFLKKDEDMEGRMRGR